jgi:hypothetical protein
MNYWIIARDKPALLRVMMRELAGNAKISFEGDLKRCEFDAALRPSSEETDALRRATLRSAKHPLDFVVLVLEPATVQPILDVVLPDRRYMEDIIHIQIEKNGRLEFGCYDNFHPECIGCSDGVKLELLDHLQGTGVIKSWAKANDPGR